MLKFIKNGDLFKNDSHFLVNACNKVGIMSNGIARTFKEMYPEVFAEYHALCKRGECDEFFDAFVANNGKVIVCFYTKNHWIDFSKLKTIDDGLLLLKKCLTSLSYDSESSENISIAFPALGCGLGGLYWSEVKPLFEKHFASVNFDVTVYEPLEKVQ